MIAKTVIPQNYPRIRDEKSKYCGFLDEARLNPHSQKIPLDELIQIISRAIDNANAKSSRTVLSLSGEMTEVQIQAAYKRVGRALFRYFRDYCGDPASSAYECLRKHYREVGKEQFRNLALQKGRMNSGWRYQYIAKDTARLSKRFDTVSDIGASEADFNVTVRERDTERGVCIYVSVKNRTNTMGGQDWPKAILALENMANSDKNRTDPYLCVFGIAMEKGDRLIKKEQKTKQPYSVNTEVWKSDFFWPFFSNYTYEEIAKAVLDVLLTRQEASGLPIEIPEEVLDTFGFCCREYGLLDDCDCFNNSRRLVEFFCGRLKKTKKGEK